MPAGLESLSSAIEAAEAMQARARDSIRMRKPLTELQELLEEASNMPVYVPEVEAVSGLLVKAQEWLKRAGNAASQVGFRILAPDFGSRCRASLGPGLRSWLQLFGVER